MTAPTYTVPSLGGFNTAEDPKIANALQNIYDILNGNVDSANLASNSVAANDLATALAQQLGLTNALNTGRGKFTLTTTETRAVNTLATLTTPDRVQNVVLPTDGLIFVLYEAQWAHSSTSGQGGAAIFLHNGSTDNQANIGTPGTASPAGQEATTNFTVTANTYMPITSYWGGLGAQTNFTTGSSYSGDVTTGQLAAVSQSAGVQGGPAILHAAAGTYTVSVQFRSNGGTLSVKNRKLWVWTMGF